MAFGEGLLARGFRSTTLRAGRAVGNVAERGLQSGARVGGRAGVGALDWMARNPKKTIAGAAILGAGASLVDAAFSPEVQEQVWGDPDMVKIGRPGIGNALKASAGAVFMENFNEADVGDPYSALNRGGAAYQTPQYIRGRPVQGPTLGNIAGSRVFGGYNISPTKRIRGEGSKNIADGSMVFGMWNARR
jgi:hypothetical protein